MTTRRALLAAGTAAVIGGCLGLGDEDGSTLGWVAISNPHEDPHTVELEIEWEGDLVVDETYELLGNDPDSVSAPSELVEWAWPDEPGQFTVAARFPGEEWQAVDPAGADYPNCVAIDVRVSQLSGALGLATMTDEHRCSA